MVYCEKGYLWAFPCLFLPPTVAVLLLFLLLVLGQCLNHLEEIKVMMMMIVMATGMMRTGMIIVLTMTIKHD